MKIEKAEPPTLEEIEERKKKNPHLQNRLRLLQQEQLNKSGKACCDVCKVIVKRGEILESYVGKTCIYSVCVSCLRAKKVSFTLEIDGFSVSVESDRLETIRKVSEVLPSRHKPKGL